MTVQQVEKLAIATFGETNQKLKAVEELSELAKELCKDILSIGNNDNISEEMADVQIMLDQLLMIYGNEQEVKSQRGYKINRLRNAIEMYGG